MSATTAPAVKKRLKELFEGAVESSTQVWYNRTNTEHQNGENVYVGAVEGNREWSGVGKPKPHRMQEEYAVAVEVEVYRPGTDAQGAEERLWAIIAQLEAVISNDETLGGQENVQWAYVSHVKQGSKGGTNGWICPAILEIAVVARI